MKVHIRFLRQGLVEAETPEGFDSMLDKEKLEWATEKLAKLPDNDIVEAMADFTEAFKTGNWFDEAPYASAIEAAEGDDIENSVVQTREWKIFSEGTGQDII